MRSLFRIACLCMLLVGPSRAGAWGSAVHRAVTAAALERTADDGGMGWLKRPEIVERAMFSANQPDRWRGWGSLTLRHENDPDHFLDAELLDQFGLTLETVPHLRYEYVRVMAVAKQVHPEALDPYDPSKDLARAQEWPGFVLHAIAEHYAKLQAAFNQVRILETLDDAKHAVQLAEARGIAIYHLGALSHFVADAAQPLHTTKHYNGWVGENPRGYKWRERFHNYIDEGWPRAHHVDVALLRRVGRDVEVRSADPWDDVLDYFKRSHRELDRLYGLERDGKLETDEGRALLEERLGDATGMLTALIEAAYRSAAPTPEQIEKWLHYDNDGRKPAAESQPATRPSGG